MLQPNPRIADRRSHDAHRIASLVHAAGSESGASPDVLAARRLDAVRVLVMPCLLGCARCRASSGYVRIGGTRGDAVAVQKQLHIFHHAARPASRRRRRRLERRPDGDARAIRYLRALPASRREAALCQGARWLLARTPRRRRRAAWQRFSRTSRDHCRRTRVLRCRHSKSRPALDEQRYEQTRSASGRVARIPHQPGARGTSLDPGQCVDADCSHRSTCLDRTRERSLDELWDERERPGVRSGRPATSTGRRARARGLLPQVTLDRSRGRSERGRPVH
jgi:hypothetical protein